MTVAIRLQLVKILGFEPVVVQIKPYCFAHVEFTYDPFSKIVEPLFYTCLDKNILGYWNIEVLDTSTKVMTLSCFYL